MILHEDGGDFKSTRKNFFIVNLVVFFLFLSNPDITSIKLASVPIGIEKNHFYIFIWVAYVYYAWRFYQESRSRWKEFKIKKRKFYVEENETLIKNGIAEEIAIRCAQVSKCSKEHFCIFTGSISFENSGSWQLSYEWPPTAFSIKEIRNTNIVNREAIQEEIRKHFTTLGSSNLMQGSYDTMPDNKVEKAKMKTKHFFIFIFKERTFLFLILPWLFGIFTFGYAFFNSNWLVL